MSEEKKTLDPSTGKRYSDDDLEFSDFGRGRDPVSPIFAWVFILLIFVLFVCFVLLIF